MRRSRPSPGRRFFPRGEHGAHPFRARTTSASSRSSLTALPRQTIAPNRVRVARANSRTSACRSERAIPARAGLARACASIGLERSEPSTVRPVRWKAMRSCPVPQAQSRTARTARRANRSRKNARRLEFSTIIRPSRLASSAYGSSPNSGLLPICCTRPMMSGRVDGPPCTVRGASRCRPSPARRSARDT
jgi:hypothetical protein